MVDDALRDKFIADLAKIYKCEPNAYACAMVAYNEHKNYQTACSLLFGLSFRTHKDWLERVAKYWKDNDTDPAPIDVAWLEAFQQMYITDVEQYPEDA